MAQRLRMRSRVGFVLPAPSSKPGGRSRQVHQRTDRGEPRIGAHTGPKRPEYEHHQKIVVADGAPQRIKSPGLLAQAPIQPGHQHTRNVPAACALLDRSCERSGSALVPEYPSPRRAAAFNTTSSGWPCRPALPVTEQDREQHGDDQRVGGEAQPHAAPFDPDKAHITTASRTPSGPLPWAVGTGCSPGPNGPAGARAIMSLLATARANGHDPHGVADRCADAPADHPRSRPRHPAADRLAAAHLIAPRTPRYRARWRGRALTKNWAILDIETEHSTGLYSCECRVRA